MKVFIASADLYKEIGGGQSVYHAIVTRRTDVEFTYLTETEPQKAARPSNTRAVPSRDVYRYALATGDRRTRDLYAQFLRAMNAAYSIAIASPKDHFDVVDTPDYLIWGPFLRLAFEFHGLSVDRVALAMHGTISSSLRLNWPEGWHDPEGLAATVEIEELQFRSVDQRYAISTRYASEWMNTANLPVHVIDPLSLTDMPQPVMAPVDGRPPDLYFVGRKEKRKGPDLLVDLLWSVDRDSYRRAVIVGPDGPNPAGIGSDALLRKLARHRTLDIDIVGAVSQSQLNAIYESASLVVIPSRYDQFNLMALDALLRGCPTAVSGRAGVVDYLDSHLPGLPYVRLSLSASRDAKAVQDALNNYNDVRQDLVEYLRSNPPVPDYESLATLYLQEASSDPNAKLAAAELFHRFILFNELRVRAQSGLGGVLQQLRSTARNSLPTTTRRAARDLLRSVQHRRLEPTLRRYARSSVQRATGMPDKAMQQLTKIADADYHRGIVAHHLAERTDAETTHKINYLRDLVGTNLVDRSALYFELARLEHKRGNELYFATYALRLMRWLGTDHFGQMEVVADILRRHGYANEAAAADAMFGPSQSHAARLAFLDQAVERNRNVAERPFEFVVDDRPPAPPRVAIVVSLYKAEAKLHAFIQMLRRQTLLERGQLEVIFIDSGSPEDEFAVYRAAALSRPLPGVYARTRRRETIQAAWNRGILLARAPYLVFLGADEGLHHQATEILARELDSRPDVDWAIGNSVVVQVDNNGTFDRDVMLYDRTGYRATWHYLDTTFLSYVGGMYRRDLHARIGFYDETFGAAGDTEFKNRAFAAMSSSFVPATLGVLNNYPEARTTESPRAEIEDLRAWYLHRSLAGLERGLLTVPVDAVRSLLVDTLRYRKCYLTHISTDLDLALPLAAYLHDRTGEPLYRTLQRDLAELQSALRELDLLKSESGSSRGKSLRRSAFLLSKWRVFRSRVGEHQALLEMEKPPAYDMFNDNRYEQHWWPWRG